MASLGAKVPIERRRSGSRSPQESLFQPNQYIPQNRRESDLARIRLSRWIDLADRALADDEYQAKADLRSLQ